MGRDLEMDRLAVAAARALAGQPSVVLVQGEPGIGKSRLVADWTGRQSTAGSLVLTGHCLELAGPALPLAAVGDALRDLVRQVGEDRVRDVAGRWGDALAGLLPALARDDGGTAAGIERSSLFEGVASLFFALTAEQPVVLVLEDLHWADASTRDLLSYLLHTMTDERLLLVLTQRDEGSTSRPLERFLMELLRQPSVEQLTLRRLRSQEVAAQVEDITGDRPQPHLLARIAELSDGIPYLVEELVADPEFGAGSTSDRVRRIVLARLLTLPAQARRAVEAASLAETELSDRLLRRVLAGTDIDVDEAVRAAVGAAVLAADAGNEGYRFRHALLRLAAAEALLPGERHAWHVRWAEAIEGTPGVLDPVHAQVAVAHHWHAAGEDSRALLASLGAAEACRRQCAYTEQSVLLRQALGLWDRVADAEALTGLTRARLADDTTAALDAASDFGAEEAIIESQLCWPEVAADPLRHLLVTINLAAIRNWLGRPESLVHLSRDRATDLARAAVPSRDKVMTLQQLCWWVNWTDPEWAGDLIEEAVRVAQVVGDDQLLLATRVDRANQRCFSGQYDRCVREYAELRPHLAAVDPVRFGMAQQFLVIGPLALGRLEEAAAEAETARARLGSPVAAPWAWAAVAGAYADALLGLGRWVEARKVLDDARALPTLTNDPPNRLLLDSTRGLLAVWQGDTELAAALAEATEPAGGETAASVWDRPLWLRAEVALSAGDPHQAREVLRQAWTKHDLRAHADGVRRLLVVAARVEAQVRTAAGVRNDEVQLGESADVTATLRRVAASLPAGGEVDTAADLQLEAELSRWSGQPALRSWQAVEEAWGRMGFPHERGWALLRLAEAHLHLGAPDSHDSATQALRSAAGIADRLAARPLAEDVAALARRARLHLAGTPDASANGGRLVPGGRRAPTLNTASTLTQRENEVLKLLIDGQTNREIAEQLYMSPKTASVHVSRIMMKLGAANRTHAATIGYRLAVGNTLGTARVPLTRAT